MNKILLLIMFAQVMLTFSVMIIMGRRRFRSVREKQIKFNEFKTMQLENAPENVRLADRNFINQFEIPVLFFVAALAALQFNVTGPVFVGLAALFVITRAIHSLVHLTSNNIKTRYYLFLSGCLLVLLMWLVLLTRLWM